jgi:hypothetical protein
VTDILQALGQNIKQLGVEISGDGIRVVTSVECIYAVKVTALALRDEVFAVAIGVLVQLRRDLGALLPFFLGVRKLADEECCSLRHGGYAFRTVTAVSVDSKEGDFGGERRNHRLMLRIFKAAAFGSFYSTQL